MLGQIKSANSLFPRYREGLDGAVRAAGSKVSEAAAAIGAFCREHRITDYPNPFPGGDERRGEWANAFGQQAQEPVLDKFTADRAAQGEEVKPANETPDFEKMTKEEIEQYAIDKFDTNLSTRLTKVTMIERVMGWLKG